MEKILIVLLIGVLAWAVSYQPSNREGERLKQVQDIFAEAKAREQARRQAYVDAHPELPERTRELILSGGIHYGMTDEQVIASLGEPMRRNILGHGREQWVYGRQTYLYFQRSRSEEHTSELQSRENLVCRLLLEKKKNSNPD